ncbi:MAG: hypothetical protein AVW06_01975 [Hadesarchaea archaeon DG-33-1]|nr:MAG: hypothetical protein AVW06_01975 [Hadesarchaea archaeon DG-33-1]
MIAQEHPEGKALKLDGSCRTCPVVNYCAALLLKGYQKAPEEFRETLSGLSTDKDPGVRLNVARAFECIFKKETHEKDPWIFTKVLSELSDDQCAEVRTTVALAIARNYKKAPEKAKRIFEKIYKKDKNLWVRRGIARVIESVYEEDPWVFTKVLSELTDDPCAEVRTTVAHTISDICQRAPEKLRETLSDLSRKIEIQRHDEILKLEFYVQYQVLIQY